MKSVPVILFLLCLPIFLQAQKGNNARSKIENLYQEALLFSRQGNAVKSSGMLDEILRLDSTWYMASFALADLAHEAGKTDEEIFRLRQGLKFSGENYLPARKFLAEALFKQGLYTDALDQVNLYAARKKGLTPAETLLVESCRFSVNAVSHPVPFEPVNPGDSINTTADEYWPSLDAEADRLVFTRLVRMDSLGRTLAAPQEDFYYSLHRPGGWSLARPVGPPVNTAENEGAQTISADGKLLIFTGCGRPDGKGSCDLYLSVNRNGEWSTPINMGEPVNSGAWESQPSLSADGETLFFVSSRSGGKGKMDLWHASRTGTSPDGTPLFGEVVNLAGLNTPGNDMSPFIHADGHTLFFASDGRPGLGGTDLFLSRWKDHRWQAPVNLGYPVNTHGNEEGLVVEISGSRAWFTTGRNPGMGRDICFFNLADTLRPAPVSYMKGLILDDITGKQLPSDLVMTDLKTGKVVRQMVPPESDGQFLVCLPAGSDYGLSVSRKGYLFASENFSLTEGYTAGKPMVVTIRLKPLVAGSSAILKNIFFDTDSWSLTAESETQVREMVRFMAANPGVVVEVSGHTDNVGTATHNLILSAKRAESVISELKKRGVEPWRLKSRGAGASQPVAGNGTEEGRRTNRRTEFTVKEIVNQ